MKLKSALLLSVIFLTLTACGGSSNDNPKPPTVAVDITPDSFTFIPHMNVETKVWHESNIESVVGIDNSVPIVISNGEYRINGGDYTSETGTINNGDTLQIRVKEEQFYTVKRARVTVGNYQTEFRISTHKQSITPKPFAFISQDEAPANQWIESNTVTIQETSTQTAWFYDVPITIEGGEYRINGGEYTSQPGVVNDQDKLQLRVISEQYGSSKTAEVTVGDYSASFIVTTRSAPDTKPNTLQFSPLINVDVKVWHESNIETVSGINVPVSVAVTDGEYRINGGDYTSETGTINNGDTLQIRAKEEQFYTVKRARVTVGNYQTEFRISTHKQSITPKPFAFISQDEAPANQWIESNTVTIQETSTQTAWFYDVPITIEGGEYRINGGEYTSQPGVVNDQDKLQLRVISEQYGSSKTAEVTVGDYSASFIVTTRSAPDTKPNTLQFSPLINVDVKVWHESNIETVSGINVPVSVAVTDGEYRINGGDYTSETGTINNGDTLQIRAKEEQFYTVKRARVTVGNYQTEFRISTHKQSITPKPFAFISQDEAPANQWIESNTVTIQETSTQTAWFYDVPITIEGGEYRINGGEYTSQPGVVNDQDKLQLRVISEQYDSSKTAVVTVGDYQTEFRISTHKQNITPKPFAFISQDEAPANQWVQSNIVIIEETPEKTARFYDVPITIEGGEYRINGGEYTSQPGVINDRDKLQLRVIAEQYDSSKTAVVTVGDYSTSFVVSIAPDTTPDDFSFTEKREQQVNSWVESDAVTITGLNAPAQVNIFHNDYPSSVGMSIDGKEYGRTATINNNQTLRVRLKPLDYGEYKLVLNIGGKQADFVVSTITEGNDSVPEQFNFTPKTNQPVNEWIQSDEIVITGLDTKSKILSLSDGAAVSVNDSIFYSLDELSAANIKVFNGTRVIVMTKLTNLFRNKTVSLNIGGVTGYFDVTAKPLDKQVLTIGRNGTQKALYTHTVASSAESKAVSYFSIDSGREDNQRHFVYKDKLYYYDSAAGGINSYDFNTGEIKQLISSSGLKSFDGIYNNKLIYKWGYSTPFSWPWEDTAYYASMYAIDLLGGAHNLIHDTVYNYSSAGRGDTSETLYMNSNIVLFGQSYYDGFAALTAYRYVLKSLDGDVLFETEKDSVSHIDNIKELISAYGETASYFSIDARNCFHKVYLDASSVNEHCYDDFYIDSLFLLDEQLFLRGRYNSSSELGIYKLSEDHESLSLITEHQAGDIKVYSVAKGKLFFIINQSLYQFDGQTSSVVQENVFSQSATGIKIGATNNQLFLIYYEPESGERTIKAYDINTLSTEAIKAGSSSSSVSFYDNFVLLEGRSEAWISDGTSQGTIKLPHGYSTFVVKDALYLYKEEKIYEFTISETELKEVYSGPIIGLETQEQHLTFMTRDVTGLKFHSIEPASGDINVTTLMSEHGQLFNINKSWVVAYPNKLFQSTTGRYMDRLDANKYADARAWLATSNDLYFIANSKEDNNVNEILVNLNVQDESTFTDIMLEAKVVPGTRLVGNEGGVLIDNLQASTPGLSGNQAFAVKYSDDQEFTTYNVIADDFTVRYSDIKPAKLLHSEASIVNGTVYVTFTLETINGNLGYGILNYTDSDYDLVFYEEMSGVIDQQNVITNLGQNEELLMFAINDRTANTLRFMEYDAISQETTTRLIALDSISLCGTSCEQLAVHVQGDNWLVQTNIGLFEISQQNGVINTLIQEPVKLIPTDLGAFFIATSSAIWYYETQSLNLVIDKGILGIDQFDLAFEGKFLMLDNNLIFTLNERLWKTDGTAEGTLIMDENLQIDSHSLSVLH